MKISRKLAIQILKYCEDYKDFYFPFLVMCKEYTLEDDDFMEVKPNKWGMIESDEIYQTFELWENLQNLYEETIELMAKGFIERITNSEIDMRNFIFYTTEGYTFQPNSENEMSDVENCQILGWGRGSNFKEAFNDFKKENSWLENSSFNRIIGVELKDKKTCYFNLK